MNVRVPADAALIPPDTGASTNWAKLEKNTQIQHFRPSWSTWQPFACASCESCLLSAGSTLDKMEHKGFFSALLGKLFRFIQSLTVLQSIRRLPLVALSSTSWNQLHLYSMWRKVCHLTLYTASTIALLGNIVTTLSEPAATFWRKDWSTGRVKSKGSKRFQLYVWRPEQAHLHPEPPSQQYQTLPLLSHQMLALDVPAMGEDEDDEMIVHHWQHKTQLRYFLHSMCASDNGNRDNDGLTFVTRFSAIPLPMLPRPMKPTVLFAGAETKLYLINLLTVFKICQNDFCTSYNPCPVWFEQGKVARKNP